MKVYFVRHGQAENNAKGIYSSPELSLTEEGKKQAASLTQRLVDLPIDLLIVSTFKRTRQTAEIINNKLNEHSSSANKRVIYSDLVTEQRRPKEIAGKLIKSPESIRIRSLMDENIHDKSWHYSDEENFYDFKARTEEFLKFLKTLKEENILVVTHIHFIKLAVLLMMLEEKLTSEIFLKAFDFLQLSNSGLTIVKREDSKESMYGIEKKTEWELITLNDLGHLT